MLTLFAALLINGIYVGSLYALLGLSFAIIFATSRIWHFAQGAVYTVAAYAVLGIEIAYPVPLALATLAGAAVAAAAGLTCLVLLYENLERRKTSPLVIVMGSLGVTGVVQNLLALAFGPTGYGLPGDTATPLIWGGLVISPAQIVAPILALFAVVAVEYLLRRSRFGRRVRALIDDDELLTLQGVDARRLKRLAFCLGSAVLAFPAALMMMSGAGVTPFMGIAAVLTGAMAVFLGGVGSLLGAALAGFLIGLVENLSTFVLPTEWQTAATYTLLLAFLVVRPTGILGRALRGTVH